MNVLTMRTLLKNHLTNNFQRVRKEMADRDGVSHELFEDAVTWYSDPEDVTDNSGETGLILALPSELKKDDPNDRMATTAISCELVIMSPNREDPLGVCAFNKDALLKTLLPDVGNQFVFSIVDSFGFESKSLYDRGREIFTTGFTVRSIEGIFS